MLSRTIGLSRTVSETHEIPISKMKMKLARLYGQAVLNYYAPYIQHSRVEERTGGFSFRQNFEVYVRASSPKKRSKS